MWLKYVGKDTATDWIAGVPARDLDDPEQALYPEAASSKFYEATGKPAAKGKE